VARAIVPENNRHIPITGGNYNFLSIEASIPFELLGLGSVSIFSMGELSILEIPAGLRSGLAS
jgi:hypothetical protein